MMGHNICFKEKYEKLALLPLLVWLCTLKFGLPLLSLTTPSEDTDGWAFNDRSWPLSVSFGLDDLLLNCLSGWILELATTEMYYCKLIYFYQFLILECFGFRIIGEFLSLPSSKVTISN